jgi:hypothetical protein
MTRATRARTDVLGSFSYRPAALPPATGVSQDIFSTTGEILVTGFFGLVTVATPNEVLTLALAHDPDGGGSDVALGTALSIQNKAVGTWYGLNATAGGVLVAGVDAAYNIALATPIALTAGDLKLTCAGGGAIGATARMAWGLLWLPLSADGAVAVV